MKGLDIHADLPISLDELAFGANISVATPQGDKFLLIPYGSLPEQKLKLKGQGFQYLDDQGDLLFTLKLKLPQKWKNEEVELLKSLNLFE